MKHLITLGAAALAACTQAPPALPVAAPQAAPQAAVIAVAPTLRSVDVTPASFGCIRDMKPVRGFYVSNLFGDIDATLAAANSTTGAVYPVGSVVQLVPTEAMVKREAGFNPATKDWEYFELVAAPTGTTIHVRGGAEVVNRFGGSCHTCHVQAQPQFDLICEQTHGCAPIPITPVMSRAIQNTDPRCPPMQLPDDQAAALRQLAAALAARPAQ